MTPVPGHRRDRAVGSAWALSFLTTLASVVFAMGSIAGWIVGVWPATPLTLAVAAAVVLGGPLAATMHLGGARRTEAPAAPAVAPVPVAAAAPASLPPLPLTPEQAWGQQLLDWRERPWRHRSA